jgi:steroid delta-isomerase-like uncharacterized protein
MSDPDHDPKRAESIWAGEFDSADSSSETADFLTRLFNEIWNQGNLDAVTEFVTPSFVNHDWPPNIPSGIEGYKEVVNTFRTGFPDLKMTLAQVVSEGNRVATRIKLEGTHRGNFFGFEPTDKFVSFGGMQFSRIENGKLTESWEIVDMAAVAQQLSS